MPQTPTATPTEAPVATVGDYCDTVGPSSPPTTVAGTVTIGGEPPPEGTVVSLAFDGAVGPSTQVVVEDGRAGYAINYAPAPDDCANRTGATVTVIVAGVAYPTGHTVGDDQVPVIANIEG